MGSTFLKTNTQPDNEECLMSNGRSRRFRRRRPDKSFLISSPDIHYKAGSESSEVEVEFGTQSFLRPTSDIGKVLQPHEPYSREHGPRTMEVKKLLSLTLHNASQPSLPLLRSTESSIDATVTNLAPQCSAPSTKIDSPLKDDMVLPPHLRVRKAHSTSQTSKEALTPDATTPAKDVSAFDTQQPSGTSSPDAMPPKQVAKNQSKLKATGQSVNGAPPVKPATPTNDPGGNDIREKLRQDHGVIVEDPKPASPSKTSLVPYPSSNEDEGEKANIITSKRPTQNFFVRSKGVSPNADRAKEHDSDRPKTRLAGKNAARGHRNPTVPRPHPFERGMCAWPSKKEMAPDPHQHDIKWDDPSPNASFDSARADSGHGGKKNKRKDIDSETGFKLTGWDGDWAPAPVDWDARPAFRDHQSAGQIWDWMVKNEKAIPDAQLPISIEEIAAADDVCGELAPRSWIPAADKQTLQEFWNEFIKSTAPKPEDDDDILGAVPWWELYPTAHDNILKARVHPKTEGIDPAEETRDQRLARENDLGSDRHTENRKNFEKAKKEAEREKRRRTQEKARKIAKSLPDSQPRETIKPGVKLYLRPAGASDIKAIKDIYNHYVCYSVCTPEIERRTLVDMEYRYRNIVRNKFPFLVACEPEVVMKGRRKKHQEEITIPEKVLGFAHADDYNDMLGMYRFTAEVEVFVHKDHYMKNIGKCLLDKMLAMLDPDYLECRGYDVEGEALEGLGESRVIRNIMIHLPYETEKPVRLEWIGKWLTNWAGFTKAGDLPKIGMKDGKNISLAIFHRTTGATVDPTNPPITNGYTK